MLTSLIVLPDGTELYSGDARDYAIRDCRYTQCVNDGSELSLGSVCCNELELTLFSKNGGLSIAAGDEITYYKVSGDATRTKIGVFRCEKPTVSGTGTYKFVAYDRVSQLDKDLTGWLSALGGWPYTVEEFANMVCSACGLVPDTSQMQNGSYRIRAFSGSGVTGRMLMQWLGQIACCFVRADADGRIEFAWYAENSAQITADGELPYMGGGLSYEDFQVAKIEKVQIQASDEDNGTVYPDGDEEEKNTYKITGNYLISAESADELTPVAQAIYERLSALSYTPCKVSVQANTLLKAGDIVSITDKNGRNITACIMAKVNNGQKDTLECTGSHSRDSSTATNNVTLKALNGSVLNLKKSVDGLRIENSDTSGKVTSLELTVEGLQTQVSNNSGEISTIKQTASEIELKVQKVMDDGVDKLTTEFGLTIDGSCVDIHRSGEEMHNSLDETGMYVRRGDEIMLQANNEGVIATDVKVRNYLIVGDHARFENYSDGSDSRRTACFWI